MKRGIDISQWQDPKFINYDQLAKNIDFAILRVGYTGYGTGKSLHNDTAFRAHYNELTKRGIPVGAYWYSCATTPDLAIAEAKKILELIKGLTFEYPIYFDTEDIYHQAKTTPAILTDAMISGVKYLENAGYYAGIYASFHWFQTRLDLSRLTPFDLWVASWGASSNPLPDRAGLWQFSSTGKLNGYAGDLDLNRTNKDYPSIIRGAGLNGFKNTPVTPTPETITIELRADVPKENAETLKKILEYLGFTVT